jgi:hypothetical protein
MWRGTYPFVALLMLAAAPAAAEVVDDCRNQAIGAPCDDDIFCNGSDQCGDKLIEGRVVRGCFFHSGDPCVSGLECARTCDEAEGNCLDPEGTPCRDDGNVCTDDRCDGRGACVHPENAAPCDDEVFCNGPDTCAGGACGLHAGDPCARGPECANACNENADNCFVGHGTPCADDDNACTDDRCDGVGVCAHVPNNDPCDDGLFCNGEDGCGNGRCAFHAGDPCAGPECSQVCDETGDVCAVPLGSRCSDDGDPCTDDLCMNGTCAHVPVDGCTVCTDDGDCDDGNPCTADSCAAAGCAHAPVSGCLTCTTDAQCDDGDACTEDRCGAGGRCTYGAALCFAGLSCTFVAQLESVDACAGERIPSAIRRLVGRAGCRVEQAEARAGRGVHRVARTLEGAGRDLGRAAARLRRVRGRKLSAPCADALAARVGDGSAGIAALMDEEHDGARLAACMQAVSAAGVGPRPASGLCGRR